MCQSWYSCIRCPVLRGQALVNGQASSRSEASIDANALTSCTTNGPDVCPRNPAFQKVLGSNQISLTRSLKHCSPTSVKVGRFLRATKVRSG